jgi:N-acetylneuraminate synthase/N,N'-diacetyllegionaminate synthase
MRRVKIADKYVGSNDPCLIIVDAGVNHNNDPERAKKLIRTAAEAGADIVKFQTYKADTITTKTAKRYWDSKLDVDGGGTQYDTFARLDDLSKEAYFEVKKLCDRLGIVFCSTPFNLDDVDFLSELDMDVFKIASADITHHQLIKAVAGKGKPVILSAGAASVGEIEEAIGVVYSENNKNIILQHCILSYPCKDEDANLSRMVRLQQIFPDIPVGYSDHTLATTVAIAAVSMGARTLEKHYTIDKSLPDSPDHRFSVGPDELRNMIVDIRRVEKSKGMFLNGYYKAEKKARLYARKSITARVDIPKATAITEDMLICKRPGTGIYPKSMGLVVGATAKTNIPADTTITFDMIR